jgi:hypothetical protein
MPAKDIEAMLAQGQPVSLIEETGSPRWFRWRLGKKESQNSSAEDESFAVHSWTTCLLELVRDPQQNRYRFQGQVRHMESDFHGAVGIYVADRAYPSSQADLQVFTQLTFNDVKDDIDKHKRIPDIIKNKPPPPEGNMVELFPHLYFPMPQGPAWEQSGGGVAGAPFRAAGVGGGPWHDLEVIVTPESLQAFWDGRSVGNLTASKIVDRADPALKDLRQLRPDDPLVQKIPTEYQPRGALGLYVERGSARFRSFRITPLPETQ